MRIFIIISIIIFLLNFLHINISFADTDNVVGDIENVGFASQENTDFTNKNAAGDYVVILHGIARSSSHMEGLAEYLGDNGYEVLNIDYPSTKHDLAHLIDISYEKISKQIIKNKSVNFVGYSMGGLVVRGIIHKYKFAKLGRVVQLASPNHGSEVADFMQDNWFYKKIYGPAGQQLTTYNDLTNLLGNVDYELGVIAGNNTIDPISSVIIPGDDDGKVSIEATKIIGMKDHVIVPSSHTFFPSNKIVQEQTAYFLKYGKFERMGTIR